MKDERGEEKIKRDCRRVSEGERRMEGKNIRSDNPSDMTSQPLKLPIPMHRYEISCTIRPLAGTGIEKAI